MKRRIPDNSTLQRQRTWGFHATRPGNLVAALPVCATMLLALLPVWPCSAQNGPPLTHTTMIPHPIGERGNDNGDGDLTGAPPSDNEKFLRALNAARQKSLVSDTNKLLRLVNELNVEIARANTGSLTATQLHKVAEIEKLAHNVKDRMSTSVRGTPAFQGPVQPTRW
jgi:hypothetical protein